MRDLLVRKPRLHESTGIVRRHLLITPVPGRDDRQTRRTCKGNFTDHAPAGEVVDALDDLGRAHAHLILPDGIGRIEVELAVLDIDRTHAARNHLTHDVRPVRERQMRNITTLKGGTEPMNRCAHIIVCSRRTKRRAHRFPS